MTTSELLGFTWIAFSSFMFTGMVLTAAAYSLLTGIRAIERRYRRGELEERNDELEIAVMHSSRKAEGEYFWPDDSIHWKVIPKPPRGPTC